MRLGPTFGSVVLQVLLATSAAAQAPPGTFAQHDEYRSLADQSRRTVHCILGRARQASIKLVNAASLDDWQSKDRSTLEQAMGGCMSARDESLTLTLLDLRGDLAEQLLIEDEMALLQQAATAPARPAQRLEARQGDQADAIFQCAVAARPADAIAMIKARPETSEEAAAFDALAPLLQACVPIKYELHLKPHLVRRSVAVALYRVVANPAGA